MNIEPWNSVLSKFVRRLDLITIIVLFPLSLIEFYKNRRGLNWSYLILLVPLIILSISGLLSGFVNGNSFNITFNGIFEYIKYFLVIFIFSAYFKKIDEFKKIFYCLTVIALFLAIAAIVQEFWADISIYVFNKDINDRGIYLFQHMRSDGMPESFWRFGFYRVSPFMNSPIIFGLYSLLILTIYLFIKKEIKLPAVFLIAMGSALSFSRIVYACMALLFVLQFIKGRRWVLIITLPILVILFFMSSMDDLNAVKFKDSILAVNDYENNENNNSEDVFRSKTRDKAIEIWKDHPLLGVGPGMFGGVVSVKYQSSIYDEYHLLSTNIHLKRIWGIDQFWFQVLAETGVVGISGFAVLFLSLISIFSFSMEKTKSDELQCLFKGLALYTLIIIIYAFGIMLNITPVLFTYSAVAGIGLGCVELQTDLEMRSKSDRS